MTANSIAISERMKRINPSATVALTDKAKELKSKGRNIVTMSAGEPDFDTPAPIVRAAKKALDDGDTHYVSSRGIKELREAIAEKLLKKNGIEGLTAEDILVTPGAKAGLMFACLALLDKGDQCICPEPAWVSYRECVSFAGADYVPIETRGDDSFSLLPEDLEKALTPKSKLLILNSPNNPTGRVWSRKRLEAIAELVERHDLFVLADEIYEDLTYDGVVHSSFASIDGMEDRCLTLNGFSKAYAMTGWRLGYIAGPRSIIDQMLKIQQHSTTCAASFSQRAALTALSEGESHVEGMLEIFAKRRSLLLDGLSHIPGIKAEAPEGTFYLFLNVKELKLSSFELAEALLEEVDLAKIGRAHV